MPFERQQLLPGLRVPDLTRPIVGASDKFVPGFVEGAVCERKDVRAQNFEEEEVVVFVCLELLNELVDETPQLRLAVLRYQRFACDNVVDQHLDVRTAAAKG